MLDHQELLALCNAKFDDIMARLKSGNDIAAAKYFDELLNEMDRRLVSGDDVEIPEHLDTPEFRNAWGEWIAYRESRRHPVKTIVLRRQIKILEFGDADQVVEILGTAIENSWKGIPDDIWTPTYREIWQGRLPAHSDGISQASEAQFEAFWQAYPCKIEKRHARQAFARAFGLLRKTHPADECVRIIMKGVDAYAKHADPQYLCYPATWLKGYRWDDEPESIGKGQPKKGRGDFGAYDPETADEPW